MDVIIEGKRFRTDPTKLIGQGGEAEIYNVGNGTVLKLYKPSSHPDFAGNKKAMDAATARIEEHQAKLLAFPKGLPRNVIAPQALAFDAKNRVVGFTMPFLSGGEVLLRYGERSFREAGGINENEIRKIYLELHKIVAGVHKAGAVIGDFNDLNVLVSNTDVSLIDADSMQFGSYYCTVFTAKFVDPMLCKERDGNMLLSSPHNANSDWYAFGVMLMQALLFVGPYGGVYRPADKKKNVGLDLRPLKRVTVFDSEVKYPKPARHFSVLPDDLLGFFQRLFVKDERGEVPTALVESIEWQKCGTCGVLHARRVCPTCVQLTPAMIKEVSTATVVARKIFTTSGRILHVAHQENSLRYVYHEGDSYHREGGRTILPGALDRAMRIRITKADTVFAKGNEAVTVKAGGMHRTTVDVLGTLPLIDANEHGLFFVQSGVLKRSSENMLHQVVEETIGTVLTNQTLFWVGNHTAFGFYRAGNFTRHFMFDPKGKNINDSLQLPPIRGQLVDAIAYMSGKNVWFMTSTRENGETINRCYLVDVAGQILAEHQAKDADGTWLGTLRGKLALGSMLLVPTDDGIVRVEASNRKIGVVKEFSDTARFVDANAQLFPGAPGLSVVRGSEIWNLELK